MQPKYFRVAVEGATVDGRTIQRQWLTQAAKNFNTDVRGARVWVEHLRSTWADSPFSAQGDVAALKAEEIKEGPLAGKMALFAAIKPLPELVELNKRGKKIYTSIEIEPKFADTGEAYVTGLAVTDDPASLGVEVLKFNNKANPNKFSSEYHETTLEFAAEHEETEGIGGQMVKAFSSMLESLRGITAPKHTPETTEAFAAKTLEVLGAADAAIQHQSKELAAEKTAREKLAGEFSALEKKFNALTVKLSAQDGSTTGRPEATGTEGAVLADC